MKIRTIVKKSIQFIFSLFGRKYLIELWQIVKNESKILPRISEFYSGFILQDMKVIDVGANVGNYSKVFISLGANVIAIEPQVYCQSILKKRFKDVEKFILIQSAVGEKNTTGNLRKSASHTVASMNEQWINSVTESNRFLTEEWNSSEIIKVTTLDDLLAKYFVPDYIKIDVEGYELNVLKGLSYPVSNISFEITLPELKQTAIECIEHISNLEVYKFAIPDIHRLLDTNNWKNKDEIIEEIKKLSTNNNGFISTDIYAKRVE